MADDNPSLRHMFPCTIWLFNIAIENPSSMEVSSWENHLFQWAIFHGELLNNQRVFLLAQRYDRREEIEKITTGFSFLLQHLYLLVAEWGESSINQPVGTIVSIVIHMYSI
jgi:hypothetical protein